MSDYDTANVNANGTPTRSVQGVPTVDGRLAIRCADGQWRPVIMVCKHIFFHGAAIAEMDEMALTDFKVHYALCSQCADCEEFPTHRVVPECQPCFMERCAETAACARGVNPFAVLGKGNVDDRTN